MIPSTSMMIPNQGIATANFRGQIINIVYQTPIKPNAPANIRNQYSNIGSYAIG